MKRIGAALAAVLALGMAGSAQADVKAGVDAWTQGDYSKAVNEWRPLANAGDADAQFNMGQAYKLGRGVPVDLPVALEWYRKAAVQGHQRAEDNMGLLMFQQGKRAEAMTVLQKSADRGEPRAQYLVGTALFNGDLLPKDWTRAYALMTRASAAGLPQAQSSLAQMDSYIPEAQRKQGLAIATQMEQRAKQAVVAVNTPPAPVAPRTTAPAPVKTTPLPPSSASAGTTYAPPPEKPVPARTAPAPAPVAAAPAPKPAPAVQPPKGGNWRVQLGAFSEEARARSLWASLSGKVGGLSAYQPYLVKGGSVTRLQAGPLASEAAANKLCASIRAAGNDCIPKAM